MKIREKPADKVWASFQEEAKLTDDQLQQFQKYADYLRECNELFNLTAITDLSGIVRQHFLDSLALAEFVDMKTVNVMADIGTGAGFPAIPLKIMYPHLKLILIEVTKKKQEFLSDIIRLLNLDNVMICDLDWRTFVRTTKYEIDFFVTRAALDDLELCRALKPACHYKDKTIIYWVTKLWEPNPKTAHLVSKLEQYKLGNKDRQLAFLALPK